MKILIIGGVAAGTKAAAKLKRQNWAAEVTILTRDREISYAGCGLPYYVGGLIDSRDDLIVHTPARYAALTGAQVLTGREAVRLEPETRTVFARNLETGLEESYSYDELILGHRRGCRPSAGGGHGETGGIHHAPARRCRVHSPLSGRAFRKEGHCGRRRDDRPGGSGEPCAARACRSRCWRWPGRCCRAYWIRKWRIMSSAR